MTSITATRMRERMAQLQIDQADLAEMVGCSQGAISQIIMGQTQRSRFLPDIADALGVSLRWLKGETDDPQDGRTALPSAQVMAEHLDLVPVQSIDLEYGLGASFTDRHVDVEVQHFPRAWIQTLTHSPPSMLTFARGRGESMAPTIQSHDMVMIDRSQRMIEEPDMIWAHTVGDMGAIKRLRVRGEKVTILSDNPLVPPDEAHVGEVNIVGRVIAIIRSI